MGCTKDSHCWPAQIRKYAGWKKSTAKNLVCDGKKGVCKCKHSYMDVNDNPMDGCEVKVNEKQCKFGKCRDWGKLYPGDQCGTWDGLFCGESGCCECVGETNAMGFCVGSGVESGLLNLKQKIW